MLSDVGIFEVVGKYGGSVGITVLLLVLLLLAVLRIPGEPKVKEKRITTILWVTGLIALLALFGAPLASRQSPCVATGNTTSGKSYHSLQ